MIKKMQVFILTQSNEKILTDKILNKTLIDILIDKLKLVAIESNINIDFTIIHQENLLIDSIKCKADIEFTTNPVKYVNDFLIKKYYDYDLTMFISAYEILINPKNICLAIDKLSQSNFSLINFNNKDEQINELPFILKNNEQNFNSLININNFDLLFLKKLFFKNNKKFEIFELKKKKERLLVNNYIKFEKAFAKLQKSVNKKHMRNGVIIINSKNTIVDFDVTIGKDTIINCGCVILGKTIIGVQCVLNNCYIGDSVINDYVNIKSSYILDSLVDDNASIGPFANIRPNSKIGKNVKIGDFVEIKNSYINDKTSISHLSYVGDSDVGKNVNLGCGMVTVNYDGVNKFRTTIGDNAFIGCNSNLVAPVNVGAGAFVAAGSTITKDVPDNAFSIARERQTIKLDWKMNNSH